MHKIPVLNTVKDAFVDTYKNPIRFLKLSSLWYAIIIAMSYFGHQLTVDLAMAEFYEMLGQPSSDLETLQLQKTVFSLGYILATALLIAGFTRADMEGISNTKMDAKTILFVFKYTVLAIIAVGVFIAILTIGTIAIANTFMAMESDDYSSAGNYVLGVGLMGIIISLYFFLRLIPVLAYTFTEKMIGIRHCWKMTKGNVTRLWGVLFIASIPLILIYLCAMIQVYDPETQTGFSMLAILYEYKMAYIGYMLIVSLLTPLYGTLFSKIYKALETTSETSEKTSEKTEN